MCTSMRVYVLTLNLIFERYGVNIRTGVSGSCKYEHDRSVSRSDGLVQLPYRLKVSARGFLIFYISFLHCSVLSYHIPPSFLSFSSLSFYFPSVRLLFSVTTAIYTGTLHSRNINEVFISQQADYKFYFLLLCGPQFAYPPLEDHYSIIFWELSDD